MKGYSRSIEKMKNLLWERYRDFYHSLAHKSTWTTLGRNGFAGKKITMIYLNTNYRLQRLQ